MIRAVSACSLLSIIIAGTGLAQARPDTAAPTAVNVRTLHDSIPGLSTGPGWGRRERGFTVGTLDVRAEGLGDAPTLPRALQARLPGVTVNQGEGIIGSTSRVWLRGPTSALINEPLLIIDGIRTHAAKPFRSFEDRELPSRLEDIDMETVERVEILRGPAAAAVYGPGASKGVILVSTRRGREGPARWTAFAESGPAIEPTEFPANFGTTGVSPSTGAPVANCPLAQQAAGTCTPLARRSWNPLEGASPFRTGWTNSAGASVTGGTAGVAWYVAASHDRADGVYETDRSRATNGHVSLSASPVAGTDMRLTATHRRDRLRHPLSSLIAAGLFGSSTDDPATRGYADGGFRYLTRAARNEEVDRTTVGLNTAWHPRTWLRTGLALGYDRLDVDTDYRVRQPRFSFPEPSSDSVIRTERASDRPEARTASLDATLTYGRRVQARSTIGLQYLREDDWGAFAAAVFPVDGGDPPFATESSHDSRRSSRAAYLDQHVAWDDRLFFGASLRVDRPTVNDVDLETIISRSVDVSWVALGEGSTRALPWLPALRLRAAYGVGGDHMIPAQPFAPSLPTPALVAEASEQGSELEVGADAAIGQHLRASVTYTNGTVRRGLLGYPASGGFVVARVARVSTSGFEGALDSRLLQLPGFAWDMGLIASRRTSELESLGVPTFTIGAQGFREGGALGEYFAAPYSYADLNGDGLIASGEVTVLTDEYGPIGSPEPDYELGLQTTLSFGGRVQVYALLDRRSGATLYDQVARVRCRTSCPEQHDPATPLGEQAAPVAAQRGGELSYFEDASYTKLREVRVSLMLPAGIARMGGASSVRLSLTGRNLATWTDYSGLDPEAAASDPNSVFVAGRFQQPPLRTFTARLDVGW